MRAQKMKLKVRQNNILNMKKYSVFFSCIIISNEKYSNDRQKISERYKNQKEFFSTKIQKKK